MSETKFDELYADGNMVIGRNEGFICAVDCGYHGDEERYTSLFAAAPELYAELEKMVEDDFKSGRPDHYQRTASARAALAKARGETGIERSGTG